METGLSDGLSMFPVQTAKGHTIEECRESIEAAIKLIVKDK